MAYGWAVAFATLCALLTALASLMLWFVAGFNWENRTEGSSDDWVMGVAFVMILCAGAVFVGALSARAWLVASGVAIGAVVSIPALRYVLVDWSDQGDGEIVAFALGVVLSGLLAFALTVKAARELALRDQAAD